MEYKGISVCSGEKNVISGDCAENKLCDLRPWCKRFVYFKEVEKLNIAVYHVEMQYNSENESCENFLKKSV